MCGWVRYMILPLTIILVGVVLGKLGLRFFKNQQRGSRAQIVKAIKGLLTYSQLGTSIVDRRRSLFFKLPKHQQELALPSLKRYSEARKCVLANSVVINDIVHSAINRYDISSWELASAEGIGSYSVCETFNHLVRDFCDLTSTQREKLFEPVLAHMPPQGRVLLPGSGVGGLAFELSKRGFKVDAIELDPALHIAAEYAQLTTKTYGVYPWALEFSHLRKGYDQTEPGIVEFNADPNVNLMFKDFLQVDAAEEYDCIVTLFFIDTAENALDYLAQIKKLLKKDGTWINYGPLKWGGAPRVEFSYDEILDLIKKDQWQLTAEWIGSNRYSGSPTSMWSASYDIVGWKAIKM